MQEASHIPKDLDACQTLILEQARALLDMQKSTEDQSQKIVELELQIDKLHQAALRSKIRTQRR